MNADRSEAITIQGGPTTQVLSLARKTRDRIRERIREFEYSAGDDRAFLLAAVRELRVLPILDMGDGRWYGVRPNGDLISFSPNAPFDVAVEIDEWTRAAVLLGASARYEELKALVPPRPLSSQPCSTCNGAGLITDGNSKRLCVCEGLGWLKPLWDEVEEVKEPNSEESVK